MTDKENKQTGLGFGKRVLMNVSLVIVLSLIIFTFVQPGMLQSILVGVAIFGSLQFTNIVDDRYKNR